MKKLLSLFLVFFTMNVYANVLDSCLQKIVKEDKLWQEPLFNKKDGIFKDLNDKDKITDEMVQKNKSKIYTLLAGNIMLQCNKDLAEIERLGCGVVQFKHGKQDYAFQFSTETVFNYVNLRTGILVINKKNLSPGDVLELSSIPKKQKFFSDECSDHTIWDNLDDDAAVNIAGQAVFNEYGGTKNEYFLDFAEGDNRRAFPGLVLMDKTGSTTEKIVTYPNINAGIEKASKFAEQLKNTACSIDQLAVYLVALDVKRDTSSEKRGWMIGAGIGGSAMVYIGLSAGVGYAFTAGGVSALGSLMGVAAPGIIAATSWWVPVAGWLAVATATAIALYPSEIEDLKQVMIIDGPYLIR